MALRIRRKKLVYGLIGLAGLVVVVVESFVLSPDVRVWYTEALEATQSRDSLVGMLDDESNKVFQEASAALVRFGPSAVPAVLRGFDRLGTQGRALAASVLTRIGPAARDALPVLINRMRDDPEESVRQNCIEAVATVGADDPKALAALIEIVETGDDKARVLVVELLGRMGPKAATAVPALSRALKDAHPPVRREAAEALGSLGPIAGSAARALAGALRDPQTDVRMEAAEALGKIGPDARDAVPELIEALRDPHPKVRSEAKEALEAIVAKLGDRAPDIRERLKKALNGAKEKVAD